MVDRRKVQEKKETRFPPPFPLPTLSLSPPGERGKGEGGEENEEIAWNDARIRAAAATEGRAAFWNNVTPCSRELGNLSRPRKSCDRFPSIAISSPSLRLFPESVPFLTCRARPSDTIPRPLLMKCASVGVTPGQSLLKTLRFSRDLVRGPSLINFDPPLSFEIFRLHRCICDALSLVAELWGKFHWFTFRGNLVWDLF